MVPSSQLSLFQSLRISWIFGCLPQILYDFLGDAVRSATFCVATNSCHPEIFRSSDSTVPSSYIRYIESSSTYFPFVLDPRLTSDFGTYIGAQCRQLPRSLNYMKPSFSTPISKRNIFTFSRSSYPMRVRTF